MDTTQSDDSEKLLRRTVIKLTATSGAVAATGTAAAQEEEEDEEDEEQTEEEAQEEADEEEEQDPEEVTEASIVFPEQTTDGTTIEIESATLPRGGFVSIQDPSRSVRNYEEQHEGNQRWFELTVLGNTEFLEEGTHEGIQLELDEPLEASRRYMVMAHLDTTGSETFEYDFSQAEVDNPYETGGVRVRNKVVGDALLEVEGAD